MHNHYYAASTAAAYPMIAERKQSVIVDDADCPCGPVEGGP